MNKVCAKCKQSKPIEEFGKDKSRPDGRFSYCKRCRLKDPKKFDEWEENTRKGLCHCSDCKQWLPIDNFTLNPYNKNGVHGQCKKCSTQRTKTYRLSHIEIERRKDREYYWNNIEKEKIFNKEYYKRNSEQIKEKVKRWHKENYHKVREQRLEYIRKWQAKHGKEWSKYYYSTPKGRIISLLAAQKRRARTKAVTNTLTKDEWFEIIKSQNNKCIACNKDFTDKMRPTIDHIIPLSKGGGLTKRNTQALCKSCNSRKYNRTIDYRLPKFFSFHSLPIL